MGRWQMWVLRALIALCSLLLAGAVLLVTTAFGEPALARAVVVLAVLLIVAVPALGWLTRRSPYPGVTRQVPLAISRRPSSRPVEGLVTGLGQGAATEARQIVIGGRDHVAAIGGPGTGKTVCVLVPQALTWDGSAVITSTKDDVLHATLPQRQQLAAARGGRCHVFAPLEGETVGGLSTSRWSPLAGCQDPAVCDQRANALVEASGAGEGVTNADHWRTQATLLLGGCFYAAAHDPERPGDLASVMSWIESGRLEAPIGKLLDLGEDPAAKRYVERLQGARLTASEKELGSIFSAARTAMAWASNPVALKACSGTDIDLRQFLECGSTLYIVSGGARQGMVAPLISCLIDALVGMRWDMHRQRRSVPMLFLGLDEVPNIAPLGNLLQIITQGGDQGTRVTWLAQSFQSVIDRWGLAKAKAMYSSTNAAITFGGLKDHDFLEEISKLIGEREVESTSRTKPDRLFGGGQAQVTKGKAMKPIMTVKELRELTLGRGVLLYRHLPPMLVDFPPPERVRSLRQLLPVAASPPTTSASQEVH